MSNETTEGKSLPEALRMIAGWLEKGTKIEYRYIDYDAWLPYDEGGMSVHLFSCIYRPKPRKPRIGFMSLKSGSFGTLFESVELTPEVRSVLEREGLL